MSDSDPLPHLGMPGLIDWLETERDQQIKVVADSHTRCVAETKASFNHPELPKIRYDLKKQGQLGLIYHDIEYLRAKQLGSHYVPNPYSIEIQMVA